MVEVIWPLSVPPRCTAASAGRGVLPLRTFIQETLRRSRTSYSTLQVALYYLVLIKAHVPKHDFTMEQPEDTQSLRALQCGRRMFLAALILASKYLQDRNYSARAWSKISGLKVCEINTNEMAFLHAVNWKLHIVDPIFERWQHIVLNYTPAHPPPSPGSAPMSVSRSEWKAIVPLLTPQLDTIDTTPRPTPRVTHTRPLTPARSATSPLTNCYSNDTTPTPTTQLQPPRFLEPRPDLLPPTPPLPRMGPLPTPQLTPQSATSSTPAAGVEAFALRRPSMCSAMAQAQSLSMARCTMEFKPSGLEAYQLSSRRPSLAPSSSSLSSSPESMISDNSRFSSRASSISSVSSAAWAPTGRPQLARLATCRNAGLPYVAPCKEKENMGYLPTEPLSAIDFTGLQLMESEATSLPHRPKAATEAPAQISPTRGRKRGRSSVDLAAKQAHLYRQMQLERETRELLQSSPTPIQDTVLPDRSVAQSFLVQTPESYAAESKALQSPLRATAPERRMPLQKELGRKRACCATEVAHIVPKEGPGMWEGILW
ncbi:PHO85 cyclin-5 [Coniosporium apollinis]|uniref:PHO85 cyclin-5 n=1 Tax=Coniosporium apollinis TaxID=61459 RepID=A0ABQ9NYJ1_9PEZI|nr:PHO85 cyclin-5 [Coniosporium apollinis]